MGGDEFVVLIAELCESDAVLALAEKLHQALKQPFMVQGHEISLSCCIGVAVYPEHGADAASLIKSADDAMYQAKAAGRDCIRLCDTRA
jgi:diguanylate cyclase (GGDEF)-like protein